MQTVAYPLTMFYDRSCPLCRQEVDLLREQNHENNLVEGHTRDAMMRLIHARDASGQWLIGPPVFSAAYRAVGIDSIAALWGASWLQPVWKRLYPSVANNRMWLSKIGVISASMWCFKKIASIGADARADARAQRIAAQSCGVDRDGCT
jgi:predicted DCC family thiol-disulfide oxidoreductase YuxK